MSEEGEPRLIWRAPEENYGHDYDPAWDYELHEMPTEEEVEACRRCAEVLYERTHIPFEVYAVDLSPVAVAMFCNGTGSYPTILINLPAHRGNEDQYYQSLAHELTHSQQEQEGREYDEDEAEYNPIG